jgi:hypothetical protein
VIGCTDSKDDNSKQDRLCRQQRGEVVHTKQTGFTGYIVRASNRIGSTENKQDRLYTVKIAKMLGCIDNKTRLVV